MIRVAKAPHLLVKVEMRGNLIRKVTLERTKEGFFYEGKHPSFLEWLLAYAKKKPFFFPLDFLDMNDLSVFHKEILINLMDIRFGQTQSYSDLAIKVYRPKAARAVGSGCGKNSFPLIIPCHRVIRKDNSLGGYTPDIQVKRDLLLFENNNKSVVC